MKAGELMVDAPTIEKSASLSEAMERMRKERTRRLLVTARGELVGLLTLREVNRVLGSRKKGHKAASSLRVATATGQNFARVLPGEEARNCITLLRTVDSLAVVDGERVCGIIAPQQVIFRFTPNGLVADHCSHPPAVDVSERLVHARRLMLDGNLSRLPVTDQGELVSMITETEVAKALYALRESGAERRMDNRLESLLVGDVVKFDLVTAPQDATMEQVVGLMRAHDIGGVPLVDVFGALAGVVTRRDVIGAL